jgi:pimeloyl-ACP methyl ester carboxylesterase
MRELTGGDEELFYMLWFQKPGVAEAVMDPKVREVMEMMLRKSIDPAEVLARRNEQEGPPSMNPFLGGGDIRAFGDPFVSPEGLNYYVITYERTGFGGGNNWYRNVDRNLEEVPGLGQAKLDLPCLMLTAEWDLALRPEMAAGMPALINDLEVHMIAKAGHWVQQEAPELVNEHMLAWLNRRF